MKDKKVNSNNVDEEAIKLKEKNDKKVALIVGIVVAILLLLFISRSIGNYDFVKLNKNNKNIFSTVDLTINDLSYSSNEEEIKKSLGNPNKEEVIYDEIYKYKKLYYDGLTVKLKENYDNYIIVGVEVTSDNYTVSRDLKVNDNIMNILKKFKVQFQRGTYIYANYSTNSLNDQTKNNNIYFGIRNNRQVYYVYRDSVVDGKVPYIAKLTIDYKRGKVKCISWSYDIE